MLSHIHLDLVPLFMILVGTGWEDGWDRNPRLQPKGHEMAARIKTEYPGVYYYVQPRVGGPGTEKVYYVVFKLAGKVREEVAGRQYRDDMTPARASHIRTALIEGKRELAKQTRERKKSEKSALENKPTLAKLWEAYKAQKTATRSSGIDDGRFQKHIAPILGDKVPSELVTLDVDRLRMNLLNTHSPQSVKHVLALLKRVIMFGVHAGLIDPPSPKRFNIKMPSFDNTKTETLSDDQLSALLNAAATDENQKAGALIRLALGNRAAQVRDAAPLLGGRRPRRRVHHTAPHQVRQGATGPPKRHGP